MALRFERRVSVGRTEAFEVTAVTWLNGETMTSFTLTPQNGLATIASSSESSGLIKFTATGVAAGAEEIHVVVNTATRNKCETGILVVLEGC